MAQTHPITQALASAMMHSSEPMVMSDAQAPDNPLLAINDAFVDLTGYARAEVVGRNCRFLQGPGTDPRAVRAIGRCVREGHACVEWIVNHRRDGTPFWNLLFMSPVRDRDGTLLHFFANQQNITTGCPAWLGEFFVGEAHRAAEAEAEFQRLILDVVAIDGEAAAAVEPEARSRDLERIVTIARRLAEVSTRLTPGRAEDPERRAVALGRAPH